MKIVIFELVLDATLDTLKLIPFLFVTYVLLEYLERKASFRSATLIGKSKRFGPVIGSLLGMIPQCGFSVIASEFYASRVITLGTLLSIYLSTSDEMIPILISERAPLSFILKILGYKLLIGILAGFFLDVFLHKRPLREPTHTANNSICNDHGNLWLDALKHTLQISAFIFIVTLVINCIVTFIGSGQLQGSFFHTPVVGPAVAALIGLIPNCAGSVIITQLYLEGAMPFGAVLAGLLASAGIGPLMLIRRNKNRVENLIVIGLLYGISLLCGILFF